MKVGNRQVVERYARAMEDDDFDAQDALVHEDYVQSYPQSGERIRGRKNRRALLENYPGRAEYGTRPVSTRIIGTDDKWVRSPSWPGWGIVHLAGSGDDFQLTGTVRYPDGQTWHFVALLTLRDGKVWREIDYFAPPFDPPDWRAPYVELDEQRVQQDP